MRSDRLRAYCPRCQHVQVFRRVGPVHRWHLLLTLLTGGLWLVSWISATLFSRLTPWRCRRCDWNLSRDDERVARAARSGRSKSRASDHSSAPTAP